MGKRLGIAIGFVFVAAACGYNPGPYTAPGQPDGAAGGSGGSSAVDASIADGSHDSPGTSHGTGGTTGTWDAKGTTDVPLGGGGGGGLPATGGQVGFGGVPASGGTGAGGIVGTGGVVTGTGGLGSGGASAAGGAPGTGGIGTGGKSSGAGGNPGTGGTVIGTGGKPGTGGTVIGTGGSPGTGGTPGTGGAPGTGGSTSRSAGCGQAPTITTYNTGTPIAITAGGLTRRYVLNIPTNYDNTKPYQLVLALHQLDGNDKQMYDGKYYGLLPLSNNTAIFAAPNGEKNGAPCSGTGSGDSSCGWPNTGGQDMALMDAVVKQVEDNFCVDTNRIVATGWSYGASMSYEIGCQRPLSNVGSAGWGVRAIAIYSAAQMSGTCKPNTGTPVAFYASHGTNDSVLNYTGGVTLAQNFASADGCTWATPTKATGSHVCTNLAGCKSGYPVEFCSFVGDHTPYPDTGSAPASWGPAAAWDFLSQF
jgi:poly(3-hydroxybutyrate) depolymerase